MDSVRERLLMAVGLLRPDLKRFYCYKGTPDCIKTTDKNGYPKMKWRFVEEANEKEAIECAIWAHSLDSIADAFATRRRRLAKALRCESPRGLRRSVW